MPNTPEELQLTAKERLLSETALISWKELEPFFAKGQLIRVDPSLDLVLTALAVVEDDSKKVADLMRSGKLQAVSGEQALKWLNGEPQLWSVVAAPWILVQDK